MKPHPAILSFQPFSHDLARRIAEAVAGEAIVCAPAEIKAVVRNTFAQGRPLVAICASGILIRILAPLLADKRAEPPVVAVSGDGRSVVPLLGGHHGANDLARRIAAAMGSHAGITTATDVLFGANLEAPPGYTIANVEDVKDFLAAVLGGAKVQIDEAVEWLGSLPQSPDGELRVVISTKHTQGSKGKLVYHPHALVVGVGCERDTDGNELIDLVERVISREGLARQSIACIASVDLKCDEQAVHDTARHFGVPARFYSARELNEDASRLKNPSVEVFREIGCPGVAEGASLRGAGPQSMLVVEKTKSAHATCAIAMAPHPIDPNNVGRKRGSLSIVGVGPGDEVLRTPAASEALRNASDWVGYGRYLDLVADLRLDQDLHAFSLGEEEARARHALSLADQGRDVAIVCSGDPGIYAMASIVLELADPGEGLRYRGLIEVIPGVSAFQAAAARTGALIGHDFCTISLSDLLTPWPVIEKRLHAAAEADFVIAFYNPRSQRRTSQLKRAIEILKLHRSDDTPVVVASNLGRERENISLVRFCDFDPDTVDMLTLVLVGSSASRMYARNNGEVLAYTPRGYKLKRDVAS